MHGMPPRTSSRPPRPATREMKRYLMMMIVSVVVLDAIAIGIYRVYHITDRPEKTQEIFVAVWVVVTLIAVTTMMTKIRIARRGS
jgi:hypothetical protein